jgi:hypothetical protein
LEKLAVTAAVMSPAAMRRGRDGGEPQARRVKTRRTKMAGAARSVGKGLLLDS